MKILDLLESFTARFVADNNESGLSDVKLTVLDINGDVYNSLIDIILSEVGVGVGNADGIYKYEFVSGIADVGWYVLKIASVDNNSVAYETLKVGEPLIDYVFCQTTNPSATLTYEVNTVEPAGIPSASGVLDLYKTGEKLLFTDLPMSLTDGRYYFKFNEKTTNIFEYPFVKTETVTSSGGETIPASACVNWTSLEVEPGFQIVSTPMVQPFSVADIIFALFAKYKSSQSWSTYFEADIILAQTRYGGDVSDTTFSIFVNDKGDTFDFPFIKDDTDIPGGPFGEITGYFLQNKHPTNKYNISISEVEAFVIASSGMDYGDYVNGL